MTVLPCSSPCSPESRGRAVAGPKTSDRYQRYATSHVDTVLTTEAFWKITFTKSKNMDMLFYMPSPMRWSLYTLPNGRKVYLTQRPDSPHQNSVNAFIKSKKPLCRFSFCDNAVMRPKNDPPLHWYPWVPSKGLPIECVYPFLVLMNEYVNSSKEGSIWLHCDSSSMRAPTFFGIYLATHFPKEMQKICAEMEVHPKNEYDYAQHSRADKYYNIAIDQDTWVRPFVNYWNENPHFAYLYYMQDEHLIKLQENLLESAKL